MKFQRDNYILIQKLERPFSSKEFKELMDKLRSKHLEEMAKLSSSPADVRAKALAVIGKALDNDIEDLKKSFKAKRHSDVKFWREVIEALIEEDISSIELDLENDPDALFFLNEVQQGFFFDRPKF